MLPHEIKQSSVKNQAKTKMILEITAETYCKSDMGIGINAVSNSAFQ